jgi:TRAP-type C4-dicarboxylate transport system permease small subunit
MLERLIVAAAACRRLVAKLGTVMGYAAGWGFILCAAFITFDVLARRFLGFSSQATTELTGYALAFGISWALAHALTSRAHVRIDVLINFLPAKIRHPMHLLSLAALAVFTGFIAKGALELVDESLLFGATDISVLRTPLWIPQGLWTFGIVVFLALTLIMLAESTLLVIAGRGAEAEVLLHARTYDEEAAEALEAVGALDAMAGAGTSAASKSAKETAR